MLIVHYRHFQAHSVAVKAFYTWPRMTADDDIIFVTPEHLYCCAHYKVISKYNVEYCCLLLESRRSKKAGEVSAARIVRQS